MDNNDKELLEIQELLDAYCRKVEDKFNKQEQQLKACKKKNELESRLAQELKLKSELEQQLAELNSHSSELERACASLESLSIAENDKARLVHARDLYEVGKDLTGVHFDFSAPSNVAKGYVKNEARRVLQAFELKAGDSDGLWTVIRDAALPNWPKPPPIIKNTE